MTKYEPMGDNHPCLRTGYFIERIIVPLLDRDQLKGEERKDIGIKLKDMTFDIVYDNPNMPIETIERLIYRYYDSMRNIEPELETKMEYLIENVIAPLLNRNELPEEKRSKERQAKRFDLKLHASDLIRKNPNMPLDEAGKLIEIYHRRENNGRIY